MRVNPFIVLAKMRDSARKKRNGHISYPFLTYLLKRRYRLFFLILCTASPPAFSLKPPPPVHPTTVSLSQNTDRTVYFEADHVSLNTNQNTLIYAGHVKITQGNTQLIAREVTLYNEQGAIHKIIATGNPAHYTTLPNHQPVPIDAFGQTITHYPQKQVADIVGNGYIKQGANSLKSDHIVYDMAKQTISSTSSTHVNDEKSFIVLQPNALPRTKTQ